MTADALQEYIKDMKYKAAFHVFLEGYVPKSLNVGMRTNGFKRSRLKKELFERIAMTGLATIGHAQANEKRGVVFVQERARFLDRVNLWGSVKAMEDCLKPTVMRRGKAVAGLGVIFDDDAKHCELKVFQAKAKKKDQGTNIVILIGEEGR